MSPLTKARTLLLTAWERRQPRLVRFSSLEEVALIDLLSLFRDILLQKYSTRSTRLHLGWSLEKCHSSVCASQRKRWEILLTAFKKSLVDLLSLTGISWGCDWGYHENGVYWEECYCAEDSCNPASMLTAKMGTILLTFISSLFTYCLIFPH